MIIKLLLILSSILFLFILLSSISLLINFVLMKKSLINNLGNYFYYCISFDFSLSNIIFLFKLLFFYDL